MDSHSGAVWAKARRSILPRRSSAVGIPFCAYDDALYGSLDGLDALVKLYAGGRKRRSPIVGDRAPHSQAVAAHGLGLRVLPALQLPLDGPHASIALFELLFG